MAFSNAKNFSRWLHISMAIRLSDSIDNSGKIWFRWKCTTQWYECRCSYSSVLSLLVSFSKNYSISAVFLGNLRIFGNTSESMFSSMYNLNIWQESGLHHIWFYRENLYWIGFNGCFHFFNFYSVLKKLILRNKRWNG